MKRRLLKQQEAIALGSWEAENPLRHQRYHTVAGGETRRNERGKAGSPESINPRASLGNGLATWEEVE